MTPTNESDWIGYGADSQGRPSAEGNDHLTSEQRSKIERLAEERARERGGHKAVVVVDVYENGEAIPQVCIPNGSSVHPTELDAVEACVALAAEALRNWQ